MSDIQLGNIKPIAHTRAMMDTSLEAQDVQMAILRRMSPERKLALAAGWSSSLRQMIRAELRRLHPNLDDKSLELKFAERWLGTELAHRAYSRFRHG